MTGFRTLATDPDVHEIAFLAGGPRRVVEATLVSLVESGRLRVVSPTGELVIDQPRRRNAVEAAVLDAVGARGRRSFDTILWRTASDERLTSLAERLERDGLLRPGPRRAGWRGRHWEALCLTGAGRRALRELRSDPPAHRVADGTSALQVALGGTGRMPDRELAAKLFAPPAPRPRPNAAELREARRERQAYLDAQGPTYGAAMGFSAFGGGFGGGDGGGCDGGGC
jgi:hypothetical protein